LIKGYLLQTWHVAWELHTVMRRRKFISQVVEDENLVVKLTPLSFSDHMVYFWWRRMRSINPKMKFNTIGRVLFFFLFLFLDHKNPPSLNINTTSSTTISHRVSNVNLLPGSTSYPSKKDTNLRTKIRKTKQKRRRIEKVAMKNMWWWGKVERVEEKPEVLCEEGTILRGLASIVTFTWGLFSSFSLEGLSLIVMMKGKKASFSYFFCVNEKMLKEDLKKGKLGTEVLLHLPPFTSIVSWKKESGERKRERKMCQKFLTNILLRCETLQQSRSDKQNNPYVIHTVSKLFGAWTLVFSIFMYY